MSHRIPISILAAAILGAGCGNDDAAEPASETAAPASVFGVYTREVTEADIARTAGARSDAPGFEPAPAGRYQLTVAEGEGVDVVKVTDPSGFTVEMDAGVDARELRIVSYAAPEKGAFCDQSVTAQAKYSLVPEEGGLALEPESEECADRDSVLTGTWEKG